jgi:hypothetical protein
MKELKKNFQKCIVVVLLDMLSCRDVTGRCNVLGVNKMEERKVCRTMS